MAQYLVQEAGLVLSHEAYEWAAEVGSLAVIRWLALEAGVSAAGCNLSSVVGQWPRSTQAHSTALLEAVQLMVGAGWSRDSAGSQGAIAVAAERGNLPLVQYMHRHQPTDITDEVLVTSAALGGCEPLLEWMAGQQGCFARVFEPYSYAAGHGDKATLVALRRLGGPWGHQDLLMQAVAYWGCEVPVLRWLVEQGAPEGDRGEMRRGVEAAVRRRRLYGDKAAELRSWAAEVCVVESAEV